MLISVGYCQQGSFAFAATHPMSSAVLHSSSLASLNFISLLAPQDIIDKDLFKPDTTESVEMLPDMNIRRFREGVYNYGEKLPDGYEFDAKIDTSDYSLTGTESISEEEIGYSVDLDLDQYLNVRKRQIQNEVWDSLTQDYDLQKALSGGDLARMLAASTGLSIPLPPNPVMSIFGAPKISLNVNGEVNVRIGWRWDTQNLGTVSQFGQTQSTPIFSQDIRVNVSGGIGDKLKMSTDWNTRRTFDLDNTFKVGFEGEDDDIIKLIEVGNVNLPAFNSLIGGGQTLFGVRADFQFGPLFLKTILSQRRGERRFVEARGGQLAIPFSLRAYDYARNYFFIDEEFKPVYRDYFKYSTPVLPIGYDSLAIKEIEVWESTTQPTNTRVREAIAFDTIPKLVRGESYPQQYFEAEIRAGEVEKGRFQLLDSTRWEVDVNLGTLRIENLSPDRTYAVSYRLEGPGPGPEDDVYVGYLSSERNFTESMILKLVYRPNIQPGFKRLWSRQMRNIYSIGASNINAGESRIGVWYLNETNDSIDVLSGSNEKVVTIFGVDRVDNSGQVIPDGEFDKVAPYFDAKRGEITFPSLEPFREGLYAYFDSLGRRSLADQYVFSEVYDTTFDVARQNTARDRFIIAGEVTGQSSNRIRLGAFNLAPGSVRVLLDGVELREYQDYIVDYFSGTVQLRNPRAMLPNANIKIEYEQQDIFQVATKTLAGVRADYNLFNKRRIRSDLGFTFMYYNQSAVIDRVQLGQEPVSNSMLGFDYRLNWDTPFITKALDLLPFYDTKAKSSIDLLGEWAMMVPEPNKRKSTIPSDDGESVVYIDDFEGAQRRITLGLNPTLWLHSSPPVDSSIHSDVGSRNLFRGRSYWYQRFIPWVRRTDIWPNQQNQIGQNNISPLEFAFDPYHRGIYNRNAEFLDDENPNWVEGDIPFAELPDSTGRANKRRIWGGMQRLFSSFNTNFDAENIEFIEIMMRIEAQEFGLTELYLDIGQISEDVIPDGIISTEDGITEASPLPNGIIDAGEDVGIDGQANSEERSSEDPENPAYPFPLNLEEDPARDDYFFNFQKPDQEREELDWVKYNNYENNSSFAELGAFPDTEVLNPNNGQTISLDNSYFRYKINLNLDQNANPQIVGGNPDLGWFQFRIPIRKPDERVGNPLFSNIQYIRLVAKGGLFKALIADWALVGSQWQRINNFQSGVPPSDSVMQVAFVNVFENGEAPDFYTMPPGVRAPRQINSPNPNQDIRLNEQSLKVCVRNLRYGEERMAVRIFPQQDLFYYKKLKFFIHGDGSMPLDISTGSIPKAYVFVRFGIDSSNYYEYRRPITQGWTDIEIDMNDLTTLKQQRDPSRVNERQEFPEPGDEFATRAIRGTPILTRTQFFGIGISNPAQRFPNELTTCIWFNELRLTDAEDANDWAALASANVKLADLGSINATFNHKEPNFHRLEERFGDRNTSGDFTVTIQGNLEKFAPKSFKKMKVPITYTHAEYHITPQFIANTDVDLERALQYVRDTATTQQTGDAAANQILKRSQNLRVLDSWALTGVRLGIPIRHWLVDETFNKLNLSYSYSQEYERSYIYANRFDWNWNMEAAYTNSIPEILSFRPLSWIGNIPFFGNYTGWKINLLPSTIGGQLNMERGRRTEQSRFLTFASPIVRHFNADRKANFTWRLTQSGFLSPTIDYDFSTRSTLLDLEFDETGRQRTGNEIADAMFFNNGVMDFGENTQHGQNFTINFKPTIPNIFSIDRYLDIGGSYSSNYNWNNPLQPDPAIADVAKNASYGTNLRLKMDLSLQSLSDSWFGTDARRGIGRRRSEDSSSSTVGALRKIGLGFKFIFFDFEKINFNLTQTNNATNPGVYGNTGMSNFWGPGNSTLAGGPSAAYQLGLVSNPHGNVILNPSSSFPFVDFATTEGLRPANAKMQDNYRQNTNLTISTSRPLWEGATLDIRWESRLGYNRNQTVTTDEFGNPTFSNITAIETLDRTFISLPKVFGINLFGNTVEDIVNDFEQRRDEIVARNDLDSVGKNKALNVALSEAFYEGLEAFSLSGVDAVGRFLPSLNWGIRWEGIEEWGMWNGYLKKVQIEHTYSSRYSESVQINDNGRAVQNQQVSSGFQPLVGVTFSFDESKVDGTLTGSVRWNRVQGYNLNAAAKSVITTQTSNEFTVQAAYTMEQFKVDLLGIDLRNDLEFSFTGSYKYNGRGTLDVLDRESFEGGEEQGRVLDGSTVINIEPRIRYSLSDRLTAAFFIRYDGTFNEGAAQPGFHTTQVGLDIRLSIAGGR